MRESADKPLISVVIPVYKVEEYLDQCVGSVLKQTYENIEVILVDDGSPDACPQKCDEYAQLDRRVRVIHQENAGLSGARNTGIKSATGKYIVFIDSDDFVSPVYVEQLYVTLSESGMNISACSYCYEEKELSEEVLTSYKSYPAREAIIEILRERDFQTSAWCKLYERSIFEQTLFPVGSNYEDYYTAPRFYDTAGGVAYTNNKLYFYRINRESITKSKFSAKNMKYFEVADSVNQYLSEHHPDLVDLAVSRDVNMAIGFCRKNAKEKGKYASETEFMVKRIRSGAGAFLRSEYPLSKKVIALGLANTPKLFMRVLSLT